jgi:hypothetical protein
MCDALILAEQSCRSRHDFELLLRADEVIE